MFELYKESSSRDRHKYAALVFLGIVILLTFIQLTCRTPADMEAIINDSPTLTEHDRFCRTIPLAGDFELRFRTVGGNSYTRSIGYWYASHLLFSQVVNFYQQQLGSDGWEMTSLYQEEMTPVGKHIMFAKGNYRIAIETAASGGAKYALSCSEVVR